MYLYSNIIGTFVFNQNFQIREKVLFNEKQIVEYSKLFEEENFLPTEKKFLDKFKKITNLREVKNLNAMEKVYQELEKYQKKFLINNTILTKNQIQNSVTDDIFIIQNSNLIGEYKKITNLLSKRLREYYSFYFPELNEQIADHKHFAQLVLENKKKLMQKYKIKDSMGKDISKNELNELKKLAKQIVNLFDEKEEKEIYLDKLMKKICPNLLAVATSTVGAQLLSLAGSLRSLVLMPASTIQILGAEKALFRHMTTGAKPPRHGVIVNHPLVSGSHQKEHGKRSRALADKILLAVKLDFFKGEFLGNKLRKELEERFKSSL